MLCKTAEVAGAKAAHKWENRVTDSVLPLRAIAMDELDATDSSRGWSLLEAMERTDPDLWKVWTDAKARFEFAARPIASGSTGSITRSGNELQRLEEGAQRAFLDVRNALWDRLANEQLVAFGSRNSPVEQPTLVYSGGWSGLVASKWDKSTLKERGKEGAKIFNVRIYPLIHSPDAPFRLAGCSLAQAFRKFVFEDPEVASLGKRIVSEERRHEKVFGEGQLPGWMIEFAWPLDLTPEDLAWNFVRPAMLFAGGSLPKASPTVQRVSSVISDRFLALRRKLVDGNVIARGTYMVTGVVGMVDPLQWARRAMFIDVRDGSVLSQEDHKKTLLWSGLTLISPIAPQLPQRPAYGAGVFHVQPTAHAPLPRNTTKTARSARMSATMESIAAAVRALWPNGVPKGLLVQQRDQRIIDWQKETGLAVASARSIARYFKSG